MKYDDSVHSIKIIVLDLHNDTSIYIYVLRIHIIYNVYMHTCVKFTLVMSSMFEIVIQLMYTNKGIKRI